MREKLTKIPLNTQVTIAPYKDSNDPRVVSLMEMGFIEGSKITPRYVGPIGRDPIAVEVTGTLVGVGRDLAALIEVEVKNS